MSKVRIICLAAALAACVATVVFSLIRLNSCTFEYERNADGGITITEYTGNRTSVVVPDTLDGLPVTEIGGGAFFLTEVTDVALPDTVRVIGNSAFCRCEQLTELNIPKSLERVGAQAFHDTPFEEALGAEALVIINDKILYKYNGTADRVTVPEGIVCIGGGCFARSGVAEVVIPDSVKYIETDAFANCESLKSIDVPAAETVGYGAFFECTALQSADVTAREVEGSAFYCCSSLSEVALNGVQRLGNSVFVGCTALGSVELPETLSEMGTNVFQGSGLTEINIPVGITEVKKETFKDCTALTRVGLHGGVTAVEESAFSGCTALSEIALPDSLVSIGQCAFDGCGLKRVELPDSVKELGVQAFGHCPALEEVRLSAGASVIPHSCFDGCGALSELIIPEGVTKIEVNAFQNASSLKYVELPDGLKTLELNCFYNSGISAVFIPDSLETFDRQAFLRDSCTTLLYTSNCKAYQQLYDAEHWRVWSDYELVEVSSRGEAEKYLGTQMN